MEGWGEIWILLEREGKWEKRRRVSEGEKERGNGLTGSKSRWKEGEERQGIFIICLFLFYTSVTVTYALRSNPISHCYPFPFTLDLWHKVIRGSG